MLLDPSQTALTYSVYPTHPPSSIWKFTNLVDNPPVLSPPVSDRSFARPFSINADLYNDMLHVAWPIIISVIYAGTVHYVNRLNKERDHKPWAFSKSLGFYIFVVTHNILLALYSGWTFLGMFNAIRKSWPGWNGEYGLAGAADALCKLHGPRGLGSAATYNETAGSWGFTDMAMNLAGGNPDSTDVGRIWNEGLAFYGWLFYISKFYEVVDTAIVLAKGKRSSFLQTYHHTGAMFCLWAGIRYMSPPIWMFTFVNSGIHTMMVIPAPYILPQTNTDYVQYTYYALSALTIQVSPTLKKTLTFLQIFQIVFGTSYALAHLFLAYDIPFNAPYRFVHNLSTALPSAASTVSSAASAAATSLATSASAAGFGNWLKKAALRAAGEEGLAENVRNYQGETFGIDAVHHSQVEKAQEEIRYKMSPRKVHCLDTSGQVFAIILNAVYLLPLLYLFGTFFCRSYINRAQQDPPKPTVQENIKKSADDAVEALEQKIKEAMRDTQGGTTSPPPELKAELENAKSKAKKAASDLGEKGQQKSKDVGEKAQKELKSMGEKANKTAQDASQKVKDATGDLPARAQQGAQDAAGKVKDAANDAGEYVKDKVQAAKEQTGKKSAGAKEQAQQDRDATAKKADEGKDSAAKKSEESKDQTAQKSEQAAKKADDTKTSAANNAAEGKDRTSAIPDEAASMGEGAKDAAGKKTEEAKDAAGKKGDEAKAAAGKTVEEGGKRVRDVGRGVKEEGEGKGR